MAIYFSDRLLQTAQDSWTNKKIENEIAEKSEIERALRQDFVDKYDAWLSNQTPRFTIQVPHLSNAGRHV